MIVHAWGAIWLNSFATVLFNVCSAVTAECFSPVSVITERRDMGLYELPLSMFLLGFGMGTMLAKLHMLVLRAVSTGS